MSTIPLMTQKNNTNNCSTIWHRI